MKVIDTKTLRRLANKQGVNQELLESSGFNNWTEILAAVIDLCGLRLSETDITGPKAYWTICRSSGSLLGQCELGVYEETAKRLLKRIDFGVSL